MRLRATTWRRRWGGLLTSGFWAVIIWLVAADSNFSRTWVVLASVTTLLFGVAELRDFWHRRKPRGG